MRLNLRLEIRDLLLGGGNGIGARDEAARRGLLAADPDECSRELGRVAGLLAILGASRGGAEQMERASVPSPMRPNPAFATGDLSRQGPDFAGRA